MRPSRLAMRLSFMSFSYYNFLIIAWDGSKENFTAIPPPSGGRGLLPLALPSEDVVVVYRCDRTRVLPVTVSLDVQRTGDRETRNREGDVVTAQAVRVQRVQSDGREVALVGADLRRHRRVKHVVATFGRCRCSGRDTGGNRDTSGSGQHDETSLDAPAEASTQLGVHSTLHGVCRM